MPDHRDAHLVIVGIAYPAGESVSRSFLLGEGTAKDSVVAAHIFTASMVCFGTGS